MKGFDYAKSDSVNPLYIFISEADRNIEEKNGNKCLFLAPTDKNKEVLEKYTELWDEIEYQIKAMNYGKPGEYEKEFMKDKFSSDDYLPLNKILKLRNLTIVLRSVFQEGSNYYSQVFLDECLYELYMLEYDRIDTSEGNDINQTNQSK